MNYVRFTWHNTGRRWIQRGRYASLLTAQEATTGWNNRCVIVDAITGRVVVVNGVFCNRKRPSGIPTPRIDIP